MFHYKRKKSMGTGVFVRAAVSLWTNLWPQDEPEREEKTCVRAEKADATLPARSGGLSIARATGFID